MNLIIDISEEDYKRISTIVDMCLGTNIDEAIKNGIPLERFVEEQNKIIEEWYLEQLVANGNLI